MPSLLRSPILATRARASVAFTRASTLATTLACAALVGCGGSDGDPPPVEPPPAGAGAGAGVVDVFTPGNVFSPFSTTVRVGGTVRFNISGAPHNVAFDRRTAGAPADIPVVANVVVTRTFGTRGTFAYECTVHPGMTGQVVVQ